MDARRTVKAATGGGLVDPNPLASYLQQKVEEDKFELSRELHDNLGGLLVGALMDAAWAEAHLQSPEESRAKLLRMRQSLSAAIDLKRRLIENLRPTLLDNVGLFAAMGWHLKHSCGEAKLKCSETFPSQELSLTAETSIAVFRFFQEALRFVIRHATADLVAEAASVIVSATVAKTELSVWITYEGQGFIDPRDLQSPEFASMQHRISSLLGSVSITHQAGRSGLGATLPLTACLAERSSTHRSA